MFSYALCIDKYKLDDYIHTYIDTPSINVEGYEYKCVPGRLESTDDREIFKEAW